LSISLAAKVFVLEDSDPQTGDLVSALVGAGHDVERSTDWGFHEWEFESGLYDFSDTDVVVWVDGNAAATAAMPESGQEALRDYVEAGGGLLSFGQNGTNYLNGYHNLLGPLLPLRSWVAWAGGSYFCAADDHPLCEAVDVDGDGVALGGAHIAADAPAFGDLALQYLPSWLAGFHPADPGIASFAAAVAAEVEDGRVVQWALWGNSYGPGWQTPWLDPSVAQLIENSVRWLSTGPPRADAGGPYEVVAGEPLYLDASGSSARGDAVLENYTWGIDGYVWSSDVETTEYGFTDLFDGPVTLDVGLVVTDSNGMETADATTVLVANADPVIAFIDCPEGAREGTAIDFAVSASDPEPMDTLTISWWMDGLEIASGDGFAFAAVDDEELNVQVMVQDDDGGGVIEACPTPIIVENVPAEIIVSPAEIANAWIAYTVVPSVTDAGSMDTHTWSLDGPDGAAVDPETGVLYWIPNDDQVGTHAMALSVFDGTDTTTVEWSVLVQPPDSDGDGVFADLDCDDADPSVFPGAVEVCDGIDNNCVLGVDEPGAEGSTTFYTDLDGDGWGDASAPVDLCAAGPGYVDNDDDCDDASAAVYPGAPEECDAVDSDCDGSIADDFSDEDGDDRPDCVDLDSDGDGIADEWEETHGLDPTDPDDAGADVDGDGRTSAEEYELGLDPTIYHGPGVPELFTPEEGSEASQPLQLSVLDAEAPLGQPLTHAFGLYSESTLDPEGLVAEVAALPGEEGVTSWLVDGELAENTWYYWTARANDTYVSGGSMPTASFFLNTVNEPPGVPGINRPTEGAVVDELEFVVDVPSDPDNDVVSIRFYLWSGEDEAWTSDLISSEEATATWAPDIETTEGQVFCWRAEAQDDDEDPLVGEMTDETCFSIAAVNAPPSAPVIDSPSAEAWVDSATPEVWVANGIDPDGDVTVHHFELDVVTTFDSELFQEGTVDTGEDGFTSWTPSEALPEDTWIHVRVQCSDDESDSEWATSTFFVSAQNDAPSVPVLLDPEDGIAFAEDGVLVVTNSIDPEGQVVTYDFQVLDTRDVAVVSTEAVDEGDVSTQWSPGALDDGLYRWTARAVDSDGEASDWADGHTIVVGLPAGYDEPEVGGVVSDDKADGCRCSTSNTGSRGWLWSVLLVGLMVQRRRNPRF